PSSCLRDCFFLSCRRQRPQSPNSVMSQPFFVTPFSTSDTIARTEPDVQARKRILATRNQERRKRCETHRESLSVDRPDLADRARGAFGRGRTQTAAGF